MDMTKKGVLIFKSIWTHIDNGEKIVVWNYVDSYYIIYQSFFINKLKK